MSKTKHTPGPWEYNVGMASIYSVQEKKKICVLTHENEANAHLIAAAPELLEALEALSSLQVRGHALIDRLQFSDEGRELSKKICAAIAKAKGDA